jgi:regulator of protease activity HflC (stomatin/prohibitin superfamily)
VQVILLVIIVCVALIGGCGAFMSLDRVDPGNVGVKINFKDGTITRVPTASYQIVNPLYEVIAEYPLGEKTLRMVREAGGTDNSTACLARGGYQINFDSRTQWQVIEEQVGQLYLKRRGVPLEAQGSNNDITEQVVVPAVRNAIVSGCTNFSWDGLLGDERVNFENFVRARIAQELEETHLKVNNFQLGEAYPSDQIRQIIANRATGITQNEQAVFQQNQAQVQGEADRLKAEADRVVQTTNARRDAEVAKIKTDQDAYQTTTGAEAQAKANRQIAESLTPELVEYNRVQRWNGQGPQTIIGQGSTPNLQVPIR